MALSRSRNQPQEDVQAPVRATSQSQAQIAWQQFKRRKSAVAGGIVLIIMYVMAGFAGFLAPYGLNEYTRRLPVTGKSI